MKVTYAVQVFLNVQFHRRGQLYGKLQGPSSVFDEEWVRRRIVLFEKSTLQSLRSQSFKDFRTWILCGQDQRSLTESYDWPADVEPMHDNGRQAVAELDSDYLSITRLDSDDLFHRGAMASIRNNQIHTSQRECLIFRNCWEWDRPNRFLHPWTRPAGPFFTHIFPWRIYRDWRSYASHHFLHHGQAGGRLRGTRELPTKMVCVVKHGDNHRYRRRNKPIRIYNEKQIQEFRENGGIFDKDRISNIMEEFAIPKEEVLQDWGK